MSTANQASQLASPPASPPASLPIRHAAAMPDHSCAAQPARRASADLASDHRPCVGHVRFAKSDSEDEFKLNLGDIPRLRQTMEVEGLKPSLLSRLLEFVAPAGKD